jgi:hypothetical protein
MSGLGREFFADRSAIMDEQTLAVLMEVGLELKRARAKHGVEEELTNGDGEWLAILVEEVGECAKSMQDETDAELRAELIQAAAMAVKWVLAVERRTAAAIECRDTTTEGDN